MDIKVYTDGSCYSNLKIGGWGVYIVAGERSIKFSGACSCKDSTSVEFLAVLKALEYLDYYFDNIDRVSFYTDCDYVVKVIREFESKGKFSFRSKTSQKNRKNISTLLHYVSLLPIDWYVIKSHRGNKGNKIADSLARKAAQLYIKQKKKGDL